MNGRPAEARAVFERVTEGDQWAAFGFIASEAELARLRGVWGHVPELKEGDGRPRSRYGPLGTIPQLEESQRRSRSSPFTTPD